MKIRVSDSMRLLIVGGSGFVGTRVVRAACAAQKAGKLTKVASISRSGTPIGGVDDSFAGVDWLRGDVLASELPEMLADYDAVISCLGAFGSNDFMLSLNGGALAEAAADAGVQQFAFISAAPIKPVAKAMAAAGYEGYYGGKLIAEEAVARHFGKNGAILRPGPIYGTRAVSPQVSIPLGAIGVPLTSLFETSPMRSVASALPLNLGDLMMPWVSVDDVAGAAVAHVLGVKPHSAENNGSPSVSGGEATVVEWDGIRSAGEALRSSAPPEVSLFWDGGCPLCKVEIAHYKRIDVERRVDWVDITTQPDRLVAAGVSFDDAVSLIHAVDHSHGDALRIGTPAFMAVWERLPLPWSALPPLLNTAPLALPLVEVVYRFWARHRLKLSAAARTLERGSACNANGQACDLKKTK